MSFINNLADLIFGKQSGPPAPQAGGMWVSGLTAPRRGSRELLELYRSSPWLKAVVSKIAAGASAVPWKLYSGNDPKTGRARAASKELAYINDPQIRQSTIAKLVDTRELREITNHPLLDLLHHGNEMLSGMACRRVAQEHLELIGESFYYLSRNRLGMPIAIWPIPPTWVKELPNDKEDTYELSLRANLAPITVPRRDVLYFKHSDVVNPYARGMGTAITLGDEIQTDEYVSKYLASYFLNNARPDFIVYGEGFTKEEGERVEKKWMDEQRGFWRRFKPLFINREVKIKEFMQNFDQLQMTQLRKHERDVIMQCFGIPPERLGVLVNSNRSTIDAGDHFWQKDILEPRLEFLREIYQRQLVPQFDERLVMDYQQTVARDREQELNMIRVVPWALTINEYREKMNLPSLGEGGDLHMFPLNHAFVRFGPEGPEVIGTTGQQAPEDEAEEGDEEDQEGTDPQDSEDGEEQPQEEAVQVYPRAVHD